MAETASTSTSSETPTSSPAVPTPPSSEPTRFQWTELRNGRAKATYDANPGLKERTDEIAKYLKDEVTPRIMDWEAKGGNKETSRSNYIDAVIYPEIDEKYNIRGDVMGYIIADFKKALPVMLKNFIREAKKDLPTTTTATARDDPSPTNKNPAPRKRSKTALDVFKADHRSNISATAKTKTEGVERKPKDGKELSAFNAVAQEQFEALEEDSKAELGKKAAEMNAKMSEESTADDIQRNQEDLGAVLDKLLRQQIGTGRKQSGEVCFLLRYAFKRPDGTIKFYKLCVTSNRKDTLEGNAGGPEFKDWMVIVEEAEEAPGTSGSSGHDDDEFSMDFSPGVAKAAAASMETAGGEEVAPPLVPADNTTSVVAPVAPTNNITPVTAPIVVAPPVGPADNTTLVAPLAPTNDITPVTTMPVVVAALVAPVGNVTPIAAPLAPTNDITPVTTTPPATTPIIVAAPVVPVGNVTAIAAPADPPAPKRKGRPPKSKPAKPPVKETTNRKRKAENADKDAPPKKKANTATVPTPATRSTRSRPDVAGLKLAEDVLKVPKELKTGRKIGKHFYVLGSKLPSGHTWVSTPEDPFEITEEEVPILKEKKAIILFEYIILTR
ncbi:hypothetical protein C8R43DRAFT_1123453 [Mycena crocata]|nr:hypothetical protein C8R43DRAFT_1123453 [Mycena crocata]